MEKAKLALVLQCYPGDMYQAEDLAELICDMEPEPRTDIEFILLRRRDVNAHFSVKLGKKVRAKFPRFLDVKSRRFGTGWPLGCNDLWQDGMRQILRAFDDKIITADGCLTFEADCIPCRRDWINVLISEWELAKGEGKCVVGHLDNDSHINGNAIFPTDITRRYRPIVGSSCAHGWDYEHAGWIIPRARESSFISQIYRINHIRTEQVAAIRKNGQIPALFHGIKNGLGIKAIREMMATGAMP